MGLNDIINVLAPFHVIQCNSNHQPYINSQVLDQMNITKRQLSKAMRTQCKDEWRSYRNLRNVTKKVIKNEKLHYFRTKLQTKSTMWKTISELTGKTKVITPSKIINGVEVITSPKKIANHMNDFYIEKIAKIRREFNKPKVDPINILNKIIKKPTFKIGPKRGPIDVPWDPFMDPPRNPWGSKCPFGGRKYLNASLLPGFEPKIA